MSFVKLDCGILNSTLWVERASRDVFITALLMAEPREILQPMPQLRAGEQCIEETGFVVPPGWYGFVPASGPGIVRMAMTPSDEGMSALSTLGDPDPESRSHDFEGRRLIRVDGGYIVLNYIAYREKDASNADRQKRWRERQKRNEKPQRNAVIDTPLRVTSNQAEAEAEAVKQEQKKKQPPAASFALPAWIDQAEWGAYLEMRQRKRAPATARACELVVAELKKLRTKGHDPTAVLAQSTRNAWTDVYPIKPNESSHGTHRESLAERADRKCHEGDERERRAGSG